MTFNPLSATKKIQESYVNFYKYNFALHNEKLSNELQKLAENNHLWKSPYISITQSYKPGPTKQALITDTGINEDIIESIGYKNFHKHQGDAITNIIKNERHTVISSGTGSGKTEAFLIPILNECTKSDVEGTKAIIIYPMNALAGDQVTRLRNYLYIINKKRESLQQRPITFGIYNSATPEYAVKNGKNDSRLEHLELQCPKCKHDSLGCKIDNVTGKPILACKREEDVEIDFQLLTRNDLREKPPDILITNYVMLERILVRRSDQSLFSKNKVKFLVLDEIHTYGGARGVDVSLLLRRFKRRLAYDSQENLKLICIGTSATMSKSTESSERKEAVSKFASDLFGENITNLDVFEGEQTDWNLPTVKQLQQYENFIPPESMDENYSENEFKEMCKKISGEEYNNNPSDKKKYLGEILLENPIFQFIISKLDEPQSIDDLQYLLMKNELFYSKINLPTQEYPLSEFIWSYLKAGSLATNPNNDFQEPLLRVNIHNFFRMLPQIFKCTNKKCQKIYFVNRDSCEKCHKKVEELGVCRNCSQEFFISSVNQKDLQIETIIPERNRILEEHTDGQHIEKSKIIHRHDPNNTKESFPLEELWYSIVENNQDDDEEDQDDDENLSEIRRLKKCLDCGSFSPISAKKCEDEICGGSELFEIETYLPKSDKNKSWRPRDCPFCHYSYGSGWAITQIQMAEKQATVNLFNMVYDYIENRKLLIFTDSRQDAAELAGWLDFAHDDTALKQIIIQKLEKFEAIEKESIDFDRFSSKILQSIEDDWYNFNFEAYDRKKEDFERALLLEISSKHRLSLERLGMIQYNYRGLKSWEEFKPIWLSSYSKIIPTNKISLKLSNILELTSPLSNMLIPFLITTLNTIRREDALEGLENKKGLTKTYANGFEIDRGGKTKKIEYGVKIHNIIKKNNRFIKYAKKVFELKTDEATDLVQTVWNFLEKHGYVIPRPLIMYNYEPIMGYVVSTGKLLLSLPKIIEECAECKNIYTNLPNNICHTYTRQKFCSGKTTQIDFNEFSKKVENSYFFNLFRNSKPTRMITREHTGALSEVDRNNIQVGFMGYEQKDRKVDVIVATPTLELGVDIGDLSSVGLYKAPPSPVNYLQRVGRAGRRNGISFINTFFFNRPIDEFYYRNTQDLIKGRFNPPPIKLENEELINRHLNSVILEQIALSEKTNPFECTVKGFLEKREENTKKLLVIIENQHQNILNSIRKILSDFEYNSEFDLNKKLQNYKSDFEKGFNNSLDYFIEEYQACIKGIQEYEQKGMPDSDWHSFNRRLFFNKKEKLETRKIDSHLFEVNFLPRYAFPGTNVSIEDIKGTQMHGGRPRQLAITEFAPGCEITFRKSKYQSVGIDLSNVYQTIFYICENCLKYYNIENWNGSVCPFCNKKSDNPIQINSLAPKKIFINKTTKSLSESNRGQAKINIYLPKPRTEPLRRIFETNSYNIDLKNYGNTRLLLLVKGIYTDYVKPDEESTIETNELEICNECGKAKEKNKNKHKPINQKFYKRNEYCKGQWQKLSLHHEMPTNVISIKISEKENLVKSQIENKRFLTTVKNAIIFAGQSITESMEGEIDGVVKDDELILYDNVEGGAGYVNTIFDKFEEVLQRAYQIIKEEYTIYGDECEHGCLRCLWSYRNKRDISLIDKKLISLLLQECTHLTITATDQIKKKLEINRNESFDQITSIQDNQDIAKILKNSLRSAKNEIVIYSPTLSENQIDWDDEGSKNWIDILINVRKGEKNPLVSVFIQKSDFINEEIIKKMLDNDISVHYVNTSSLGIAEKTLDHMLVVIDPYDELGRKGFEFSNGLTEQIWKDISTIFISKDDKAIALIRDEIRRINNVSRKINEDDLLKLEKSDSYSILPRDKKSLSEAVSVFTKLLENAKHEIKLMDPYMKSNDPRETLQYYMSYFCKFLSKDVKIKIITAGHTINEINNVKSSFSSYGFDINIISYNVIPPNTRISHRRFMIIDDQKSIWIDKGLRFLYECNAYGAMRELSNFGIFSGRAIVKKDTKTFDNFWNYKQNKNDGIKKWPKNETRRENES